MNDPNTSGTRRGGRERSEKARIAVLTAAAHLLGEAGFDHLSIEGIAREAGVGKQTVYRWWPSKAAIISECLLEGFILPGGLGIADVGTLREDLTAWLRVIFDFLNGPNGNALRSLIAVAAENETVAAGLNATFADGSVIESRLRKAVGAGDLRPGAPTAQLSEFLVGVAIVRAINRQPTTTTDIDDLVTALLAGHEEAVRKHT